MLKCHNLLVRLFQNGTGGHQVISKNQACQEICCHVLTCARSATATRQSQKSLLGLSHWVSTRHQSACVPVTPESKAWCFCHDFSYFQLPWLCGMSSLLLLCNGAVDPSIYPFGTTYLTASWRFVAVKQWEPPAAIWDFRRSGLAWADIVSCIGCLRKWYSRKSWHSLGW